VWFGHIFGSFSEGRFGCRYSISTLVDRIASKMIVFERYFPNIKVGDIEPTNAKWGGQQSIIDDIVSFEEQLRKKSGMRPRIRAYRYGMGHFGVADSVRDSGVPTASKRRARRSHL